MKTKFLRIEGLGTFQGAGVHAEVVHRKLEEDDERALGNDIDQLRIREFVDLSVDKCTLQLALEVAKRAEMVLGWVRFLVPLTACIRLVLSSACYRRKVW